MKKVLIGIGISILIVIVVVFSINFYVILSTQDQIIKNDEFKDIKDVDCILVLGAGIWGDEPSPMLEDRLLEAIKLYEKGVAPKIIMSGAHGREEYDEVNIMKNYAIEKGVSSENIFMDHAGFSTYDSVYRAKDIFEVENMVIVTQEYHLYRALHIANSLDIKAYGVNADPRKYAGQLYREIREILARNKDFVLSLFKPKPTYLGESIPVSGNGDITNDKITTTEPISDEKKALISQIKDKYIDFGFMNEKNIKSFDVLEIYQYGYYATKPDVKYYEVKFQYECIDSKKDCINYKVDVTDNDYNVVWITMDKNEIIEFKKGISVNINSDFVNVSEMVE